MHKNTVIRFHNKDDTIDRLTELLRHGAHDLIKRAVPEGFEVFLQQHADRRDVLGRAAVVRNGYFTSTRF